MSGDKINYLNMGLMVVSLVAAFMLPFEVFLFSYAFLGPLHYLTEISWLHDRKYFSPGKRDYIPLVILSILILFSSPTVIGKGAAEWLTQFSVGKFLVEWSYDLTFVAFGIALIFIVIRKKWPRIFGVAGIIIASALFHDWNQNAGGQTPYFSVFAVYIPTLIHVYIFTMLFMLFGALKRRSVSGQLSVLFMILCAVSCFILFPNTSGYEATEWARTNYNENFRALSYYALNHFGNVSTQEFMSMDIFSNGASVMLARFIAFAYTYHYLNWFSKTKVIGWHKVPKLRFALVILAWVASVALYLIDYNLGFRWLFLLSFAHVLLEFPLNHQSIIGIGREIRLRVSGAPAESKTTG